MNARSKISSLFAIAGCALLIAACDSDTGATFGGDWRVGPADATGSLDGRADDAGVADSGVSDSAVVDSGEFDTGVDDTGVVDAGPADTGAPDTGAPDTGAPDTGALDTGVVDAMAMDAGTPDTGALDTSVADAATPDSGNTTGLTVPCKVGPGWTLFRFSYGGGSKSPSVDVWDASCSYSFAPNSACNVYAVYPGFGEVDYTSQGYPVLTSSEYLRVRFSVAGLSFTKAAVYIQARSYATSSSTDFQIWSPLYGGLQVGPVDNDWVYDWYGVDWTGFLYPSDKPSLTAIQIYAAGGSGKLAVKAVELCVQ